MNGRYVLIQPSLTKRMNLGIIVAKSGSMIVLSISMNQMSRPGQFNLAKENATREDTMTLAATGTTVMMRLFRK